MRNGLIIEEEFQTQLISTLTLDMSSLPLLILFPDCSGGGRLTGADSAAAASPFLPPAALKQVIHHDELCLPRPCSDSERPLLSLLALPEISPFTPARPPGQPAKENTSLSQFMIPAHATLPPPTRDREVRRERERERIRSIGEALGT